MKSSSLDLVFGRCNQWKVDKQGNYYECNNEIHNNLESYSTLNLGKARFWRYVTSRLHQKDDFTFPNLAAVQYLPNAHCYRIFFNPLLFWSSVLMSKWVQPLTESLHDLNPLD